MKIVIIRVIVLVLLTHATVYSANSINRVYSKWAHAQCGSTTAGALYSQGWKIVKEDYIKRISNNGNRITLEDGTIYGADMTIGMLVGDEALLLRKYVKLKQDQGYIYTICAGGFDAWVNPVQ